MILISNEGRDRSARIVNRRVYPAQQESGESAAEIKTWHKFLCIEEKNDFYVRISNAFRSDLPSLTESSLAYLACDEQAIANAEVDMADFHQSKFSQSIDYAILDSSTATPYHIELDFMLRYQEILRSGAEDWEPQIITLDGKRIMIEYELVSQDLLHKLIYINRGEVVVKINQKTVTIRQTDSGAAVYLTTPDYEFEALNIRPDPTASTGENEAEDGESSFIVTRFYSLEESISEGHSMREIAGLRDLFDIFRLDHNPDEYFDYRHPFYANKDRPD